MITFLRISGIIIWVLGGLAIISAIIPQNGTSTLFGLYKAGFHADDVIAAGIGLKLVGVTLFALSFRLKKQRTPPDPVGFMRDKESTYQGYPH